MSLEFRRINGLPPYVLTIINNLKTEARRAGEDVLDFGFGNRPATGVHNRAADGSRRATLSVSARTRKRSHQQENGG